MNGSPLSFLCDARVQLLSAQEECFLNRLLEVRERYPMSLNERDDLPADPVELRNLCYPHKPEIRNTHVGHWLAKMELASLGTVYEHGGSRWLELDAIRTVGKESGSRRDELPQPRQVVRESGIGLIHNADGLSPPEHSEIIAAAAAASDSLDLIARLRPFFPDHNVALELKRYRKHRESKEKPEIALLKGKAAPGTFVHWMLNAEKPIRKKGAEDAGPTTAPPSSDDDDQLDLFEEKSHTRFMAEFERRKKAG